MYFIVRSLDGRNCNVCGVELNEANIWPSWYRRKGGTCRDCDNNRRNERRRNGAEPFRARRFRGRECREHEACKDIERWIVFELTNGYCGICKDPIEIDTEWHMDHIIPLSKNGKHCYHNLQPSHPVCNLLKGDTILVE